MRKIFNRNIILLLVFILTVTSLGITTVFAYTASTVSAPTNVKAESTGPDSVTISWDPISGADAYRLYRADSLTSTYDQIKYTTSTSYQDGGLVTGKTYFYKVQSFIRNKSNRMYSAFSAPIAAIPGAATQPAPLPTTSTTTIATIATTAPTTAPTTTTQATISTTSPTTTTQAPTTSATTTSPTTSATTATPTTRATTAPTTTATTTTPTTTRSTTTTSTTTRSITTTTTTTAPATSVSAVSVKSHGALGNGVANDTAAIQRALNTGAPVISIPDGVYMVDALVGLKPKSNQTIQLTANATLKVIPNAASGYQLFYLTNVSNVEISGGKLLGDRTTHLGTTGEHGMGIQVGIGTSNVRIKSMTISNFWGDGIYVGGATTGLARNVLIDGVICDYNRRQGLSITQAEYVTVRNSIFKNTSGKAPQCGLDIEPNTGGQVRHVTIENNQFLNNAVYGLIINAAKGPVDDVLAKDNTFSNNANAGFAVSNTASATNIRLAIKPGTTAIKAYEYSQCYGLDQVTIPSTVTSIGNNAFQAAYDLASVTIPSSVTSIGENAFKYNKKLTSIRIPASVTSIGNYAFIGCSSLRSAYFYGNAPVTTNYLFYNTATDFRVYYVAGRTGFTSPTWRGYPSSTFVP